MIATYNTLTANVVVTAIQAGAVQMQIDATRELIDINSQHRSDPAVPVRQGLRERDRSCRAGIAARAGLATLPPLIKQSAQLRDLLAVLAGRFPSQAPSGKFELSSLQLPEELPVSLPSELVAQRPDVLQAEANLHAASAQIGIATANRLPNIQLTANAGSTALGH